MRADPEFFALVRSMRDLQIRWFKGDKSSATLHAAKQAERAVDEAIEAMRNGQSTLPFGADDR